MCIKPQALLDAMAQKLERDGVEPSARDVAALVASGCTEEEVARALERARARRKQSEIG
jgi:hypothetical protein